MPFENIDFSAYRLNGMTSYERVSGDYQKKQEYYHDIDDVFSKYCTLLLSEDETINQQFRQLGIKGPAIQSVILDILSSNPDFIKKVFALSFIQVEDHYHSLFEKLQHNLYELNKSLQKESEHSLDLQINIDELKEEIRQLTNEVRKLREELHLSNCKLETNSTNSNLPPSSDLFNKQRKSNDSRKTDEKPKRKDKKPVFNTREKTQRKPGAQPGHPGRTLSNKEAKELIDSGEVKHEVVNIGKITDDNYKSGYILDFEIVPVVKEIRVPKNESLPEKFWGGPVYGPNIQSLAILLGTEGLLGYDRTARILNEMSGNVFSISEGKVYDFNQDFFEKALADYFQIKDKLKKAPILYTDATHFDVNKKRCWIRNHSYGDLVLYWPCHSKKIIELFENPLLNDFQNILVHDHETALYNLDCDHAECNIHTIRHLKGMKLLTGHLWPGLMIDLFTEYDHKRNQLIREDQDHFSEEELKRFKFLFHEIIRLANRENKKLESEKIRKKERALINRLLKYYDEHTLFLNNFDVDFTNNRSERDLRIICKKRKMISTFRNFSGLEMFCVSLTIVESLRKQETPVLQGIQKILLESSLN